MPSRPRLEASCVGLGAVALAALAVVGCSDEPAEPCSASGQAKGSVITFATFARQVDDTTAEGVDIDGLNSDTHDAGGCYRADFVSPDGRGGIDNQFATLLPIIEDFVGTENIDAILEGAIANGQLLLVIDLTGVDDARNDSCVDMRLGAGLGTPFLDATGAYEPYQTFGFDRDVAPVSELPGARIEHGVLSAGPADVVLPVRILDAAFNLELHGARFRLNVHHDDLGGGFALSGYGGGGLAVQDFKDIVASLNITGDVANAVVPIVSGIADLGLDENGDCQQVSTGLRFSTTPAFVLDAPE